MKTIIMLVSVIALLSPAILSAFSSDTSGVVKVIVESNEEGRIADETETFRDDDGWTERLRTDELGEAQVSLPNGIYTVSVRRAGYFLLIIKDFEVRDGAKIERIIHLKKEKK